MQTLTRERIIGDIIDERIRQIEMWGDQNHPPVVWSTILSEEAGEVAKAALSIHFDMEDDSNYREELLQCAAVCIAAIESLDKQKEITQEDE